MTKSLGLLSFLGGASAGQLWVDVCTQADVSSSVWCDPSAAIGARAAAFVAALKPEEKVPIMTNEATGVPRLHIPPYQWGSEGLHGPLEPCVCGPSSLRVFPRCAFIARPQESSGAVCHRAVCMAQPCEEPHHSGWVCA